MMKYILVKVLFLCLFLQVAQAASTTNDSAPAVTNEWPLLKEITASGLQAVAAVHAAHGDLPNFIWPTRYGHGLGSFLTLGNSSEAPWMGQIAINGASFGVQNYLFANINGTPVSQSMNGRTTIINVEIPAHQTLVLGAVAEVSRFAQGSATVGWKEDGAKGQITIESPITPNKVAAPRAGWNQTTNVGNLWTFNSAYFDSPVADIQNFPFYGGVKDALIVLPTDPSPEETRAAEEIQRYFQDWGKDGIKPAQNITLEIISGLAPRQKDQPLVYVGESLRKIHTRGIVLQVGKTDAVSLQAATIQLMNVLGQKYFYRNNTE